jgi:hypothetical protein
MAILRRLPAQMVAAARLLQLGLLLLLLLLLLLATPAAALPTWTHERLNTYIHCANASGPWSAAALAAIVRQQPRFVVQERCTGRFAPPANASAEKKMTAAAQQIKAANGSIEVYMYNPTFPVVEWYDYGRAAEAQAAAGAALELRWPNGSLYDYAPCASSGETGASLCGGTHVLDFRTAAGRETWIKGMSDTVKESQGALNGAFIDGFRGGVGTRSDTPSEAPPPTRCG